MLVFVYVVHNIGTMSVHNVSKGGGGGGGGGWQVVTMTLKKKLQDKYYEACDHSC